MARQAAVKKTTARKATAKRTAASRSTAKSVKTAGGIVESTAKAVSRKPVRNMTASGAGTQVNYKDGTGYWIEKPATRKRKK